MNQKFINTVERVIANHENSIAVALLSTIKNKDYTDEQLKTPLIVSAMFGNTDLAEWLINVGANVNAQDEHGMSALMYAASIGDERLVNMLFLAKANLSLKNNKGESALDLHKEHKEIFVELSFQAS